ncbi:MAG: DNRLRE domain-containing protein [Pseudomonadota bacterium]
MRNTALVIISLLLTIDLSHAAAVVYSADADTYVRDGKYADDNYGSDDLIKAKSQGGDKYHRRTLIRFDLSEARSTFEDAVFSVTQAVNGVQQVEVFGLNHGLDSWDENSLTFNNARGSGLLDDGAAVNLGLIDFSASGSGQQKSLRGNALTQFLRNGIGEDGLVTLLLVSTETDAHNVAQFASREGSLGGPGLQFTETEAVPLPGAALLFVPIAATALIRRRCSR